MIEKRVVITIPEDIKASDLLPFAEKVLKEYTDQGWNPDYVFLNFCNYLTRAKIDNLLKVLKEVTHVGFGPTINDILPVNR